MSFPNYPEKHKIEPLFTAEDLVAYRERLGRMPKVRPEGVLFCLERGLPHRMRWRIPVERAGSMNADVYAVKKAKGKVAGDSRGACCYWYYYCTYSGYCYYYWRCYC